MREGMGGGEGGGGKGRRGKGGNEEDEKLASLVVSQLHYKH